MEINFSYNNLLWAAGTSFQRSRDDGAVSLDNSTFIRGNFQALSKFRVHAGDEVLKEHIETSAQNAMYSSKETQNRMIVICGDIIRRKI